MLHVCRTIRHHWQVYDINSHGQLLASSSTWLCACHVLFLIHLHDPRSSTTLSSRKELQSDQYDSSSKLLSKNKQIIYTVPGYSRIRADRISHHSRTIHNSRTSQWASRQPATRVEWAGRVDFRTGWRTRYWFQRYSHGTLQLMCRLPAFDRFSWTQHLRHRAQQATCFITYFQAFLTRNDGDPVELLKDSTEGAICDDLGRSRQNLGAF